MPSMTSVKYSNAKFRKIALICGISVAAVILVAVGIYFLIHNGVFYKKTYTDGKSYELTPEMQETVSETEFHRGYMFSGTVRLLSENRLMDPWVLSWYVIPGTTRSVPAMESAYVDSFDQVLLLESYVKDGKRSKAESLIKAIDDYLIDSSGYLLAFRKADDLAYGSDRKKAESCEQNEDQAYLLLSEPPVSMKATTGYLRALLDYYDKWGSSSTLDKIKTLAGKVFTYGDQTSYRAADQMAMPTPIPVTEKSLITPMPDDTENTLPEGSEKDSEEYQQAVREITKLNPGYYEGTVSDIIFKGMHYEIEVQAHGFEWLVLSTRMFQVGTKVLMSVDPFNIQIMNKPESEDEKAVSMDDA